MAVHVDAAGHDDQPRGRRSTRVGLTSGSAGGSTISRAGDPDVAHLAVDPVGRVVDRSAGNFEVLGRHGGAFRKIAMSRTCLLSSRFSQLSSRPRLCRGDQVAVEEQQLVVEQSMVDREIRDEPARGRGGEERGPKAAGAAEGGQQLGGSVPKSPIVPRRMPAPARMPHDPNTRMLPAIMLKPAASPHEPPTAKVPRRMAAPTSLPDVAADQDRAVGHPFLLPR